MHCILQFCGDSQISHFAFLIAGHDSLHCNQWNFVSREWPNLFYFWAQGVFVHLALALQVFKLTHSLAQYHLQGPSISIDTACSSSLVGVHLACTSFLPCGCSHALATGVNLTLRSETTAVLSKAGMLSIDGRCKTLDAAADGYMRGEACIAHLLEALAECEPTCIHSAAAIVMGSAVNQDGRSSSLTAPNGPSQQAVVREALAWSNLSPQQVGVLEMHGTGTALGDPIEVGAAFAVYQVGPV